MLGMWSSAGAVVIDEATFNDYGGDVTDVANSIKTHNEQLRASSYSTPWLVVGHIGGCTGTWLGNKEGWAYVLSAAHCVDYRGTETAVNRTFTSSDGRVVASGPGTAYVPSQRIEKPPGMGGASTDIAILKLPLRNPMHDATGDPIDRPILNDALDEKGRDVIFVGYGSWGVGSNGSGSYWPASGERRLYGRSRIDGIFELDHGISARYEPAGPSPFWALVAAGDSGSAWWQMRDSGPVIIATTNGGSASYSTGARVSKYVDWIKSVYPDARLLSAERPRGCLVSLKTHARFCLPAGETSDASLPSLISGQEVYVDSAPGTAVMLSDRENFSHDRIATFVGTVEHDRLKQVKAASGEYLDFSRPKAMRVVTDTTPLGCIVSLASGAKYCLPAGQTPHDSLPDWIYMHEVQIQAAPGTAVMLSDRDGLAHNRVATFAGFVQNWELKKVKAWNGEDLDFARPKSMRVVQQ